MDDFANEALPHLPAIQAFALRLTGNHHADAADLVQDTYHRALRYWATYEKGTNCKAWLFCLCRNQFLETLKRRRRHPDCSGVDSLENVDQWATRSDFSTSVTFDPEMYTRVSLLQDRLAAALDQLPEFYRAALRLLLIEGRGYWDISTELGIPLGTVKSRIHRARYHLRGELRYLKGSLTERSPLREEKSDEPSAEGAERAYAT